jgi:hypothetical protein
MLKQALCSKTLVDYPRKDRHYTLIVDACTGNEKTAGGMGAILCETDEQCKEKVISCASEQLAKHEKITPFPVENGSHDLGHGTFQHTHFGHGRHFTAFIDHKPLEVLGKNHERELSRIQESFAMGF